MSTLGASTKNPTDPKSYSNGTHDEESNFSVLQLPRISKNKLFHNDKIQKQRKFEALP